MTPAFDAKELEKLRRQVMTDLAVASAEPSYIASREMRKRLYGENPYSRTVQGEVQDVKTLTVNDLKEWWFAFARPDLGVLYFSGDITIDRAVELSEQAFGSWKATEPKPETKLAPIPESAPTHIYLVDKAGDQSQIRIAQLGITYTHPQYFTSRVVSNYFGGAFGSRLNENLRVKKGLTYGARGGYSTQHLAGEFGIGTFTKNESVPEAVQASIDEIKRLQAEPPNSDELEHTKAFIIGSFAGDHEMAQSVAGDLWFIESEGLPEDHFRRMLKAVQATDANQCVQLAQSTLDPSKLVIVVVGPADTLKPKLEVIAPVTVVKTDQDDGKKR